MIVFNFYNIFGAGIFFKRRLRGGDLLQGRDIGHVLVVPHAAPGAVRQHPTTGTDPRAGQELRGGVLPSFADSRSVRRLLRQGAHDGQPPVPKVHRRSCSGKSGQGTQHLECRTGPLDLAI